MTFIWPDMLIGLIIIPLAAFLYFFWNRKRSRILAVYKHLSSPQQTRGMNPGFRRHVPPAIFLLGSVAMIIAIARPQTVIGIPRQEGTVILAFDVSGSMVATDLKPDRLSAAKTAALDFIQKEPSSVQIGIVAFSDSGFTLQTPTNDQLALSSAVDRLNTQHGTSLASGINASLNAISANDSQGPLLYSNQTPQPTPTPKSVPKGSHTSSVIVLLTDGENNENPDPIAAAQKAADMGIRIYTVGVGSPNGTTIHVNGFNLFTQLDEPTLKQISQITGGQYFNAQNAQDLQSIYDNLDPQLVIKPEKMEVTSLFAGISILILLAGAFFSFIWFNRLP